MIKVKLRQKAISQDRQSLYLDFYPPIKNVKTGELTRREFLGLYLFDKPKTISDRKHNKETQLVAEMVRQKRDNEINKPEIYSDSERLQLRQKEQSEQCFVIYFKQLASKRQASNYDNWISCRHHLEKFTNGHLRFNELNEQVCNGFKDYLLNAQSNRSKKTKLSQNTTFSYYNKFKAAIKQAYKDGYLQYDLNARLSPIKPAETKRSFLTIEELNSLVKTECSLPVLKNAALFSALTGLRFSDIQKLIWDEVEFINNSGYFIHFRQKKTEGFEVLPIPEQAFILLGERKKSADKVFEGLKYSAWTNMHLFKWLTKAGITKDITFHCFRHTYATLQLSKGTDIYTVSKMLGHRELKTTQIYGKIIDKTKRDATDKIKLDF